MSNGVINGKGLEWAVVRQLHEKLGFQIVDSNQMTTARESYDAISTDLLSTFESQVPRCVDHIINLEPWILSGNKTNGKIWINSDAAGQEGDVRDVMISCEGKSTGISCKNNHTAFKHSRLSPKINFPSVWKLCREGASDNYMSGVKALFLEIKNTSSQSGFTKWSEIDNDRKFGYYKRLLDLFRSEIFRIRDKSSESAAELASGLVKYVIGRHDFYKLIIKDDRGLVEGYSLSGSLKVPRIPLPSTILAIEFIPDSAGTVLLFMDAGYSFSFRIHSAKSEIELSLKFDIQAIGLPREVYRHHFIN